eukprot:TRINITY_DN6412_c0_g1_i6.p1 TRINITY_DN6412_c0_g1~~TRINITY_DN6412_c0_g1_i6.p1  ORF type:complete len:271 (+),score=73.53 TRINITY_DN6412_c0_g1_i6:822-1634(+)
MELAAKKVLVLSINSMHFSERNLPTNDPKGPKEIFEWMELKLDYARKRGLKVIFVYHIPHGEIATPFGSVRFWQKKHEDIYMPMIKKNADIIAGIYTGHIHISGMAASFTDSIEARIDLELDQLKRGSHNSGQMMNRAVSPVLGNNPGFTLYYYDEGMDYASHYEEYTFMLVSSYNQRDSPLDYWRYLYNSKKDLGINNLSENGIRDFLATIDKDFNKFMKYMMYRMGKDSSTESLSETISQIYCRRNIKNDGCEVCLNSLIRYAKERYL